MTRQPIVYLAYLLRLWRSGPGSPWRASLEDPQTGERLGFSNLAAAFRFIQAQTKAEPDAAGSDPARKSVTETTPQTDSEADGKTADLETGEAG